MSLIKTEWEKDKVYLVQFPRTGVIPCPSPYSLKLETWLRMAEIPYENVSNEFKHFSTRGQQPFIEFNGTQISDSSIIIETLAKTFGGKGDVLNALPPKDKAIEHPWIASDKGYARLVTGVKAFFLKNLVVPRFESRLKAKINGQWIGTLTKEEVVKEIKKDIDAISAQLGEKSYLFGENAKTIDATLFGHLAQILYTPQFTEEIRAYIETKTPNLITFVNRIKEKYWPDWDEICETLNINTDPKK